MYMQNIFFNKTNLNHGSIKNIIKIFTNKCMISITSNQ